jgi:hypothetical protein
MKDVVMQRGGFGFGILEPHPAGVVSVQVYGVDECLD